MQTELITLGGPGSGNFGHGGRPGEVGGSSDTLYHGTSLASAQKIKTEGLKPGAYENLAYAGEDLNLAMNYASQYRGDVAIIVLKPEARSMFSKPTGELANRLGLASPKTIPPELIKEIRVYKAASINRRKGEFPRQVGGERTRYTLLSAGTIYLVLPLSSKRKEKDESALFFPLEPTHAARLLMAAVAMVEARSLGGPGSGNFGHAGRPGEVGGSGGDGSARVERNKQAALAAAQTNPLAHPEHDIVLGLNREGKDTLNYVAAYGQEFTAAKLPDDVERGEPKECYKNASLLVLEREDLTYAEGFAKSDVTGDLTFMHAWAVDKAGNVVDPTWDRPENGKYFGVKYDRAAYLKYLYTAKIYGVMGSTHNNARKAIETGVPKLRGLSLSALGGPGSGNFGHAGRPGEVGGSSSDGGSMIGKPSSHYEPSRADGLDTRERFSDGNGNYTPERVKLHAEIVQKYMRGTTAVKAPVATVLGGGMASGKSTLVNSEGIGKENTVLINVDEIRNELPEYAAGADGKRPASIGFTHEEASDISKQLTRAATEGQRNIVLDGTGDTTLQKLGGKVATMRASGHEIVAEYVTTSVENAQARADARGQKIGRFVPPTAMREAHREVSRIFPEAVRQGLFDRARVFDTTGKKPQLIASSKGRTLTVHDAALWERFLKKGGE